MKLDVFQSYLDGTCVKRSATVILVKNLPFSATTEELKSAFEPFGDLGRVSCELSAAHHSLITDCASTYKSYCISRVHPC